LIISKETIWVRNLSANDKISKRILVLLHFLLILDLSAGFTVNSYR